LHDGRQHRLGGERGFQALAQAREDGGGIVALAVEQPVDRPLQTLAQGMEEQGDQVSGQDVKERVITRAEQRTQRADDQHIQTDDAGSECAIDQGAVDEAVNIVEAILEDGETGDEWQAGEHERRAQGEYGIDSRRWEGGEEAGRLYAAKSTTGRAAT